ncbi:Transcriptional regulator [Oenococcus oeni]|nr:Transcriptional regulator [Oenococcus oeni]
MNDVARLAGVSRGTVSNYINGFNLKDQTKLRIEKAIKDLKYIPNLQARELKTSKNSTVVFIVPVSWTPFFSEMVYKMQIALSQAGYKMILANSHADPKEEKDILRMATLNQVAGVITMSYSDISNFIDMAEGLNLVSIEHFVSDKVPLITSDSYQGGRIAAKELMQAGCKKVLLLRRKTRRPNATDVRTKGFLDYLSGKKIKATVFEASLNDHTYLSEFNTFFKENMQNDRFLFDGIFSVTDEYARAAFNFFSSIRLSNFDKNRLIGFDGSQISPNEPLQFPSIRQNVDKMVKESVKALLSLIQGTILVKNYKKTIPVNFQKVK